jgi:hypothetical protein
MTGLALGESLPALDARVSFPACKELLPVVPFNFLVELGLLLFAPQRSGLDANLLGNRTVIFLR